MYRQTVDPRASEVMCLCRLRVGQLAAAMVAALERHRVGRQLLHGNVSCTRCGNPSHGLCHLKCLEWDYINEFYKVHYTRLNDFLSEANVTEWSSRFVCIVCKLTTADPFYKVQKIFGIQYHAPVHGCNFREDPPRYSQASGGKCDVGMRVVVNSREATQCLEKGFGLQVRVFKLKFDNTCYPKFPNGEVEIHFSYGVTESSEKLKRPPNMRLRQDHFVNVNDQLLRYIANNNNSLSRQPSVRIVGEFDGIADGPYIFALAIVEPDKPDAWYKRLKATTTLPIKLAEEFVRNAFFGQGKSLTRGPLDDELDIIDFARNVKLTCPSTMLKIDEPARGINCLHVQCFELEYYVHSQNAVHQAQRWRCPICKLPCRPEDIIIDSWLQDILHQTSETDKLIEVYEDQLTHDLKWKLIKQEAKKKRHPNPELAAAKEPALAPEIIDL
ncbi:MIZ/SP-ring zinc finger protein [Gregarina niphandrodes]|uniref:MIZ/SP-ring zinc finger protein n=1 Tax=Gregarina niphandrodes TaxID=110365 RepID=A0A023AX48_GRENI|nr:MIZ/SP-ring zinc finger protein [Gregarina niphandrodes]EZG43172.1 MIZ/SP-ring zinc finger protein [Gregarina niphandrodes]|eukprot:XP_011133579.1 MIZ/SP-ring zinc finger protein [Gregarina niphandrodes]